MTPSPAPPTEPTPDPPRVAPALASLPNYLTVARLFLAIACFVALDLYDPARPDAPNYLYTAAALFVIAAITDTLDGFLARRWRVTSAFGRIMDPFADKLLVLGAFVYLASPAFTDSNGRQLSAVAPWMVIVIFAREMLATAIRGYIESRGKAFGADWSGKAKMILQSICVPVVLIVLAQPSVTHTAAPPWALWTTRAFVWTTVFVTIISGWRYALATIASVRERPGAPAR